MTYEILPSHERDTAYAAKMLHHYIAEQNRASVDALRSYGVGELSPFITLDTALPHHTDDHVAQTAQEISTQDHTTTPTAITPEKTIASGETSDISLLNFSATSLPQIFDRLHDYYAHHATKKMKERHIPSTMMETILARMTNKVIDTFHDKCVALLAAEGMPPAEAEQFYIWRMHNEHQPISFTLQKHGDHDHVLHADNFMNDQLLALFHNKSTHVEHASSPTIHTSEDIDALFNNL